MKRKGRRYSDIRLVDTAVRIVVNAAVLWVTARLVGGIEIDGVGALAITAVIFGVVNALIKPAVHLLGCPFSCLTLGIFAIVINAAMLVLTTAIAGWLDLDVSVAWFWPAFFGAIVINFTSTLLGVLIRPRLRRGHDERTDEEDVE
jgi:putative membrane protein